MADKTIPNVLKARIQKPGTNYLNDEIVECLVAKGYTHVRFPRPETVEAWRNIQNRQGHAIPPPMFDEFRKNGREVGFHFDDKYGSEIVASDDTEEDEEIVSEVYKLVNQCVGKPTAEQITEGLKKKELSGVATGIGQSADGIGLPDAAANLVAQFAATGKKEGGKKTRKGKQKTQKGKKSVQRRRTAKRSF